MLTGFLVVGSVFKRKKKEPDVSLEMGEKLEADNPRRYACPNCGGRNLIVEADNSAFCIDCRVGYVDIETAARAKTPSKTAATPEKNP